MPLFYDNKGDPNIFSGLHWMIETGGYFNYIFLYDGIVLKIYLSDFFLKLKTWQYLGLVYDYDAGKSLLLLTMADYNDFRNIRKTTQL